MVVSLCDHLLYLCGLLDDRYFFEIAKFKQIWLVLGSCDWTSTFRISRMNNTKICNFWHHDGNIFCEFLQVNGRTGLVRKHKSVLIKLLFDSFFDVLSDLVISLSSALHIRSGFKIFLHFPACLYKLFSSQVVAICYMVMIGLKINPSIKIFLHSMSNNFFDCLNCLFKSVILF